MSGKNSVIGSIEVGFCAREKLDAAFTCLVTSAAIGLIGYIQVFPAFNGGNRTSGVGMLHRLASGEFQICFPGDTYEDV